MTSAAQVQQIFIPAALPHQRPVLDDPSPRKVWRAGRRTGKSRGALIAGTVGHGPRDPRTGAPSLRGILHGANGVWVAPDYPQARAIWREEIEPRFAGIHGVELNQVERRVSVAGRGRLELRSGENVDSIRGSGLDFAILDEAAHFHLAYALNDVILPALLDKGGWLFIISSPNAGHDGNPEHTSPAFFNTLCEEIMGGRRVGWKHWHNKSEDNRTLSSAAVAALRAEYPPGSPTAAQELDAELGVGAGRFYPELSDWEHSSLLVKPSDLPMLHDWYEYWGAFDWGFAHPACFGSYCRVENTIYKLDTLFMHRYQDEEQAATIKGQGDKRCFATVYAGGDAFAKRQAHSATPETVQDVFARYSIRLEHAVVDKIARAKTLRRMFADPHGPLVKDQVRIRFVDTPGNRRCLNELASLVPSPLDINVPAKRDANDRGENGDDGADETSFALASPSLEPIEPLPLYSQSNIATGQAEPAPWEILENKFRMPDEDGKIDRRVYVNRRGLDASDEQFGDW